MIAAVNANRFELLYTVSPPILFAKEMSALRGRIITSPLFKCFYTLERLSELRCYQSQSQGDKESAHSDV